MVFLFQYKRDLIKFTFFHTTSIDWENNQPIRFTRNFIWKNKSQTKIPRKLEAHHRKKLHEFTVTWKKYFTLCEWISIRSVDERYWINCREPNGKNIIGQLREKYYWMETCEGWYWNRILFRGIERTHNCQELSWVIHFLVLLDKLERFGVNDYSYFFQKPK